MIWQALISGLLLGFVSSFHCLGMCGPLVLALPFNRLPNNKKIVGVFIYHFARISVYVLLGVFFSLLGRRFFIANYQQTFSIILGVLVLVMTFFYFFNKKIFTLNIVETFTQKVQNFIVKKISQHGLVNVLWVGAANGLLPCGMVYFAIMGALAMQSLQNSIVFMAAFGLGTLPFMFLITHLGIFIKISVRNIIKKIVPFFLVAMGILLILRGLNLGIPYISPEINNTEDSVIICH